MNEESLEKYEGIIDENGLVDYDSLLDLIQQKKKLEREVERLREQFELAYDWVDYQLPDGGMQDFAKYIGDD